jgi:hypothetical protein
MAQAKYGDYGVFTTAHGSLRFQFQNKLIKESLVPLAVVERLKTELGIPVAQIEEPSHFDKATAPSEQAKVIDTPIEENMTPLDPNDFDVDEAAQLAQTVPAPMPTQVEVGVQDVQEVQQVTPNPMPNNQAPTVLMETTPEGPNAFWDGDSVQEYDPSSIHTATIEDMAKAMFERFGVYTIWLGRYPEDNEISPITGEPMPSYERGVAYTAAKRAFMQGRLTNINYEGLLEAKRVADEQGRAIRQGYDQPIPQPTVEQNEAANNFDFRTSVKGANQSEPEIAPLIHVQDVTTGQMVVIRDPNWKPSNRSLNGAQSVSHPEEVEPMVQQPLNMRPGDAIIRENW